MAGHHGGGWLRAEEATPSGLRWWDRLFSLVPLVCLSAREVVDFRRGGEPGWFAYALLAVWALFAATALWRRWRPAPGPSRAWVVIEDRGIRRSTGHEWIPFADLARVDRQEQWPNLALHRRNGVMVRLFPWNADRDDAAVSAVADAALARAAAAGADTTQQPVAMWRPSMYEVDWDRAIVAPSRWSRFWSSSPGRNN